MVVVFFFCPHQCQGITSRFDTQPSGERKGPLAVPAIEEAISHMAVVTWYEIQLRLNSTNGQLNLTASRLANGLELSVVSLHCYLLSN